MFGHQTRVQTWTAGGGGKDVAGWHCSWCLGVDGIRSKLMSAQNGDFPRWGNYREKQNTTYIKRLIARGIWFDDVTRLKRYDFIFGPPSLLTNEHRYWNLIHNVYERSIPIALKLLKTTTSRAVSYTHLTLPTKRIV